MIEDEICRERMEFYVLEKRKKSPNPSFIDCFSKDEKEDDEDNNVPKLFRNTHIGVILTSDFNLLVEYAPKLFNTYDGKKEYESEEDLDKPMLELAKRVYEYRQSIYAKNSKELSNKFLGYSYKKIYEHRKKEDYIKAYKNHLNDIHHMMGGHHASMKSAINRINEVLKKHIPDFNQNIDIDLFKIILEDAYINPDKYIYNAYISLKPKYVKDYLLKLKLPSKIKEINSFIKALQQQ